MFKHVSPGYLSLELENGYEVALEPLIWKDDYYLAVYKDKELVSPKVRVKLDSKEVEKLVVDS